MPEDDTARRILAFAAQLHAGTSDDADADAAASARERGWIDAAGMPTDAGRELIESLDEQAHTRTTFRHTP